MEQYSLEGTWEEILCHGPELAGQRVRLTVLARESPKSESAATLDQLLKDRVGRVAFEPTDLSVRTKDAFIELLDDKYNQSEVWQ